MSEPNGGKRPGVLHVFDDIEEMDNNLPHWWLGLLWGTILFAFGYWFYFHAGRVGLDHSEELALAEAALAKRLEAQLDVSEASLLALAKDPVALSEAEVAFSQTCASCHAGKAEGLVGPNLTDAYWLHGGKAEDIFRVISEGKVEKGMPAWGKVLGAKKSRAVAAYVVSLKGRNVPGKPPQGELVP